MLARCQGLLWQPFQRFLALIAPTHAQSIWQNVATSLLVKVHTFLFIQSQQASSLRLPCKH